VLAACARGRLIALMIEEATISGTVVNIYQTTRRNNPEDSHLHIRRRESLKSHNTHIDLIITLHTSEAESIFFTWSLSSIAV
jgi:hypothetical protein